MARGIADNDPDPRPPRIVEASVSRMSRLLGIELDAGRVRTLVKPLGFETSGDGDLVKVSVPSHRLDVEVAADVSEEVARAYGYDRVVGRLPQAALPPYRPDPGATRHSIRRILAGLGLDEVVTYALIGPDDLRLAGLDPAAEHLVRVSNPLSEEHSILRPSMAPSLLGAAAQNARRRQPDAWLFEVGKTYWYNPGSPSPRERVVETAGTGRYEGWELAIVLSGRAVPPSPGGASDPADVATVKGIVDALHEALGVSWPSYRAEPADARHHPHRHPGRTGLICDAAGRPYGSVGEVHPRVVEAWGLAGRPVDAAIDLDRLLAMVPEGVRSSPISALQPVDRDLAVVVGESTPVGEVLRVATMSAGPLLEEIRLFDIYRGEQVGPGRVSYALALRFAPMEAGDEKAIEKALNKVRGSLRHHLEAEIR